MKKKSIMVAVLLALSLALASFLTACSSKTALKTPTLSKTTTNLTWTRIDNAVSYTLKIGEEEITGLTSTSYALAKIVNGGTHQIKVKAVGDGDNYADSEWSNEVTHSVQFFLGAPTISIEGNTISWTAVANASSYTLTINDSTEIASITNTSYQLNLEDVGIYFIRVKSIGTENYPDSAWSNEVEYIVATEGLTFTLNDDELGYSVSIGEAIGEEIIAVPAEFEGLPVTAVSAMGFASIKDLSQVETNISKEVLLPSSVKTLNAGAFYENSKVERVVMKGVESIAGQSFYKNSSLKNVVMGDKLTTISEGVFAECPELTSIIIPNSVTTMGENNFYRCGKLTIYYEGSTIPSSWAENGTWNASARYVVLSTMLSEDKSYVTSFYKSLNSILNPKDPTMFGYIEAPYRMGHTFSGWSTTMGGTASVEAKDIESVSSNTTLYAVWTK